MRRGWMRIAGGALVLCALAGLWPAGAGASIGRSRLRAGLADALRSGGGRSGAWVYDLDAPARPLLFARHGRTTRVLASNTKLFTTAALIHRLGARHRLATRVWTEGRRAGTNRRILRGSLDLVGAGDPALSDRAFAESHNLPLTPIGDLAGQVRQAGIRTVRRGIVADDSVFDRVRTVPETGIAQERIPPLSGLSYDPGAREGDPARNAGQVLKRDLENAGVTVHGTVHVRDAPSRLFGHDPIAAVRSPTIAELAAATNKPSNNFYAEMLLKRLAAHPDGGGTTARGARLARRFAHTVGSGVRMENGSGLSRLDTASPRQVGRLLAAMARLQGGVAFRHSLSIAGRDGTLAHRMIGTRAAGRCRAKTGTLSDVSALSGYCNAHGDLVAFSILFNGVDVSRAQDAEDRMAVLIANYER